MDTLEYQEQFFKYMHINYPTLSYNDILLNLSEKYNPNKFYYSLKKFNNFKMNHNNKLRRANINENYLDHIELRGKKLLKSTHRFIDPEEKEHIIKIYGTNKSMQNLSNKDFTQFFVDSTYKCIPNNMKDIKAFLLVIGYNSSIDSFELCCAILLSSEDTETLIELYSYLKNMWHFIPNKITYDFALGNINAIKRVYEGDEIIILPCLFHLIQAWWRKMSKLGFRKKEYITTTKIIILNLKLLPFMPLNSAINFYKKVKNEYDNVYKEFFVYFENTWLSLDCNNKSKYDFNLWSYDGKFNTEKTRTQLIAEKKFKDYVFFSNNACESLNHLINSLIAVNNNVSLTRFELIIKTLFIRMEYKKNEDDQNEKTIERKQQLSDILIELIKLGFGVSKGLLNRKDISLIKNLRNENDIFKLFLN